MSAHSDQAMTNHHESGLLAHVGEVLHTWRRRYVERGELAAWTDRDLNDLGLSWDDVAHEIQKPFWRG